MNTWKLVLRNLSHYRKKNLTVILGIAISAAVLTGALMVGDSVSYNLKRIAELRLGKIGYTLNTGERFITSHLASILQNELRTPVSSVLMMEGIAVADGGQKRVNKIRILGVDGNFDRAIGIDSFYNSIPQDEVIISQNLASRLDVQAGDEVLFRIKKASLIPLNAPFVSDNELVVSARLKIKAIAGNEQIGRFSLNISQTSPFNAFVSIGTLNRLMSLTNKANFLLISGGSMLSGKGIMDVVQNNWSVADAGLILRDIQESGEIEILSERVFLDQPVMTALNSINGKKKFILTYFVNSLYSEVNSTPYSFVSTLEDSQVGGNEIVINKWLADDQDLSVGDSINIKYFTVGLLRRLTESEARFVIKGIVPIEGPYADKNLMPVIPGLSDAGNCRDWETGVPVNLDNIRDKDEKYWADYKGTPKAFIAKSKARKLWENSFGSYTAVRFPKEQISPENLSMAITKNLRPESLGFKVNSVRNESQVAALHGVDFSQLFLGLSFFVLVAAAILTVLLLILNLEGRREQLETLSALGIPNKVIRLVMNTESLILSAFGSLLGMGLAILYTRLVFIALNGVWIDIVRTDQMEMKVSIPALLTGFFIAMIVSWLTLLFTIRRFLVKKQKISRAISQDQNGKIRIVSAIVTGISSIVLIMSQVLDMETVNPEIFFLAGGLMLLSMLILFYQLISLASQRTFREMSLFRLAIKNAVRNKNRSISIVAILALGTFLVISIGANRRDMYHEAREKSSGTGGFLLYSESTVPVVRDLNNLKVRQEIGLTKDVDFVQLSKIDGDDASCLNLNKVSTPPIFGVEPLALVGRFSFVSKTTHLDENSPWLSLDNPLPDDIVPAIADETVIKWGLGKNVGDTLVYTDGNGLTTKLLLIGGLENSIFQGNIIISSRQFLAHFPDKGGSNIFLIDGVTESRSEIESELRAIFRDYGWEMVPAVQRLEEFNSIENTYLSIFLVLGALAILIGTVGLGVILARSILERRKEIALMKAVGIGRKNIFRLFMNEYLLLLLCGILIGVITSTIATIPSLVSPDTQISLKSVMQIAVILLLNGIFWICSLAWIYLKDPNINEALRNE